MALTNIINQDELNTRIAECLETIKARIAANIDSAGLTASGRTKASMRVEETADGGMLVGRQYFQGLEIGRPAGAVPRDFRSIILQWMRDKGIQVEPMPYKDETRKHVFADGKERAENHVAAAIAHKIRTEGFKPRRGGAEVGRQTDIYTDTIAEEVEALKRDIAVAVVRQMSNIYDADTGERK